MQVAMVIYKNHYQLCMRSAGQSKFRTGVAYKAGHYGFMDPASRGYAAASEKLDFLINYDIKYRTCLAGAPEQRRMGLGGDINDERKE